MKTRAELHRESLDPESVYGHLEHVTAERQALALEGIEDLLRQLVPPILETKGLPFSVLPPCEDDDAGIVRVHGYDITVTLTRDEGGKTDLQGAAKNLVHHLNGLWTGR